MLGTVLLAVAFDALRVAVAHAGQLSDRRLGHLWDAFFAAMAPGGPPGAPPGQPGLPGGPSGQPGPPGAPPGRPGSTPPGAPPSDPLGMHLRYPAAAAAACAELRQLAGPASLDIGVLEQGVEDHSSAAPLSVRKADEALDLLADVLAVELLLAADVLDLRPERPALGRGTGHAHRAVRTAVAALEDRSPAAAHAAARAVLPTLAGEPPSGWLSG